MTDDDNALARTWSRVRRWYINPFRARPNIAEMLTVFVTIVIAVIGALQYSVYRQQKRIMESAGTQTNQLIEAAELQAEASRRIARASSRSSAAAESFSNTADDAVEQFKIAASNSVAVSRQIAKETEESIAAAQAASNKALDETIDASRLDQRAWISLLMQKVSSKATVLPHSGLRIDEIILPFINSGKTPALNITARYLVRLRTWKQPVPDYDEMMKDTGKTTEETSGVDYSTGNAIEKYGAWGNTFLKGQVIGPGSIQAFNIAGGTTLGNRIATKDDGSTMYVYLIGRVNYDDAVGTNVRHKTRFCLVNMYGGEPANTAVEFRFCSEQNWMD